MGGSNTVISDAVMIGLGAKEANFLARWHSYAKARSCLGIQRRVIQTAYKIKMSSLHSATFLVPDFIPPSHLDRLLLQDPLGCYNQLMQPPSDSPPPASPQNNISSLKAPSAPDTSVSPPSIPSNSESYNCQWVDCSASFTDPEILYNHLCNDHIGRKSTNNLCLTCKWKDCGTSCAKRDHITSHLRGMSFSSPIMNQY
jgi:hypothetical protein